MIKLCTSYRALLSTIVAVFRDFCCHGERREPRHVEWTVCVLDTRLLQKILVIILSTFACLHQYLFQFHRHHNNLFLFWLYGVYFFPGGLVWFGLFVFLFLFGSGRFFLMFCSRLPVLVSCRCVRPYFRFREKYCA